MGREAGVKWAVWKANVTHSPDHKKKKKRWRWRRKENVCSSIWGIQRQVFGTYPADDDGDGQLKLFLSWMCLGDPKQERNILIEFYCWVSFSLSGIFH